MEVERIFTNDWFERDARIKFERHLSDLKINKYLEVGVCEGASMLWVLDFLKPNYACGVDNYRNRKKQEVRDRYRTNAMHNLRPFIEAGLADLVVEDSRTFLANDDEDKYDLIYIDGDHSGWGAMVDMLLAYRLLTKEHRTMILDGEEKLVGGTMVIDDLNRTWNRFPEVKVAQMQFELLMHGHMRRIWLDGRQCAYVRIR